MCETFHLEFSQQGGIYAWADPQLFEDFAGPAMQNGDFWKIHLGRCVSLDQDDADGSAFIDGLLEDALLFPYRGPTSGRTFEKWETVEETPGIWVTRLKANRNATEESMGENDLDSDAEDHSSDIKDVMQSEDMALENPPTEDTGPIRADKYTCSDSEDEEDEDSEDETCSGSEDEEDEDSENSEDETVDEEDEDENDEDGEDDEDDEDEDTGAFITANVPDAIWEPTDEEDWEEDEILDKKRPSETK
jgi:hypothetical protein